VANSKLEEKIMGWKEFGKDYLTFSRKERIGILTIAALVIGIWFSPKILSPKSGRISIDSSWISAVKKLRQKQEVDSGKNDDKNMDEFAYDRSVNKYTNKQKGELFYFDPNTITINEWSRLGLPGKTIHTIQNYLNKGGHFNKPADLQKIYGFRQEEYQRLEPYIKIPPSSNSNDIKEVYTKQNEPWKEQTINNTPKYRVIEINIADTAGFISLPGIGSKLALRIINFRDKLGGFYSIDQIGETYGLADSTFQKIKQYLVLKNTEVRKFNINTATKDEMKLHPYLKWNLANAIVEYRAQHGNYSSIEDLKKISLINDDIFNKLKFYLTL